MMNYYLKQEKGFSLMELVVVIAVIGILATIALPSYNHYVMKLHRIDGINALNGIQFQQEKYRSYNASYGTLPNLGSGVIVSQNNSYTLSITNPTAAGYTATATAQGSQAKDNQNGVSCSVLTLTVNGQNTTQTPFGCWAQ
jgi:type IV pilus assembly protein PilE